MAKAAKKSGVKGSSAGEGEAPRRGFFLAGYALAGLLALLTTAVFGLSVYQFDFWENYFWRSTVEAGSDCQAAVLKAAVRAPATAFSALALHPIKIPHKGKDLDDLAQGPDTAQVTTAYFNCQIPVRKFGTEAGIVNLHTGWVVGDRIDIFVNGKPRSSFNELGKPAVPLTIEDLHGSVIRLEVLVSARAGAGLGFIGLTPMVVAQGPTINARILAVDFALSNQKQLYTLLPLLTLGLTMVFGWLIGIRTRMMTVTFFYLLLAGLRNVAPMFADFWPWGFESTFLLSDLFLHASLLGFSLFAMEMLGLMRENILKLMALIGLAVLLLSGLIVALSPAYKTFLIGARIAGGIETLAMISVIGFGRRATRLLPGGNAAELAVKRTRHIVVYLVAFVLCGVWFDGAMIFFENGSTRLLPQVEKLLPLVVGGILFYTLYLIEQMLRDEREHRAKMETELTIAAKLQGVLVPKDLAGVAHGFRYDITSKPHGILGGDWVKVYNGKRGALFVLGDVVGKGPSAALTHSGIAASWETQIKLWERGMVTAQELMAAINCTMFDLYQGTMNTTFAFAEVDVSGKVRLAAGGNYWLHLTVAKTSAITSPGRSLLGLKSDFNVELRELELKDGEFLVCFTDGVLEGNRPVSRFLRAVQPEIATLSPQRIRELLVEAGKDQVHPDDASTLVLKFEGAQEQKIPA